MKMDGWHWSYPNVFGFWEFFIHLNYLLIINFTVEFCLGVLQNVIYLLPLHHDLVFVNETASHQLQESSFGDRPYWPTHILQVASYA